MVCEFHGGQESQGHRQARSIFHQKTVGRFGEMACTHSENIEVINPSAPLELLVRKGRYQSENQGFWSFR
jgi:hypothetical protein